MPLRGLRQTEDNGADSVAEATTDGWHARNSKNLAHLRSRLIKRHIASKTLLEIVNRGRSLIKRLVGRDLNWLRSLLLWIRHFVPPFGASRPS
jgi:hypothetical protein